MAHTNQKLHKNLHYLTHNFCLLAFMTPRIHLWQGLMSCLSFFSLHLKNRIPADAIRNGCWWHHDLCVNYTRDGWPWAVGINHSSSAPPGDVHMERGWAEVSLNAFRPRLEEAAQLWNPLHFPQTSLKPAVITAHPGGPSMSPSGGRRNNVLAYTVYRWVIRINKTEITWKKQCNYIWGTASVNLSVRYSRLSTHWDLWYYFCCVKTTVSIKVIVRVFFPI